MRRVPTRSYLICTLPRSGSWLLADGLRRTSVAGHPEEYFWPQLRDLYIADWSLPDSISCARFFDRVLREGTTENGIFGAKVHGIQVPSLRALLQEATDSNAQLPRLLRGTFPDLHLIRLVRNDRTAQALSWYRALSTDNWWHINGANDLNQEPALTLDVAAVAGLERRLAGEEARWDALFTAIDVPVHRVAYEELSENYAPTIREVLAFLGVEPPRKIEAARLARQADAVTDRWRREYDAARGRRTAFGGPRPGGLRPGGPRPGGLRPGGPRPGGPRPGGLRPGGRPGFKARPATQTAAELAPLLAHRRWQLRTRPFRHVVAHRVFTADFHRALADAFADELEHDRLVYHPASDDYSQSLTPATPDPLAVFGSAPWHELFASALGVSTTGESSAALHHHLPGALRRLDLDPAVHAAAILVHLGNGPWRRAHGGEIGLYRGNRSLREPGSVVPPLENSLLAFACTPLSLCAFMPSRTRRSYVVTFLHLGGGDPSAAPGTSARDHAGRTNP